MNINTEEIKNFFLELQKNICSQIEIVEQNHFFKQDHWLHNNKIQGQTHYLSKGNIFEKAAVSFSHIIDNDLPKASTKNRKLMDIKNFQAMGVSVILHPNNPFIPSVHLNVRFFIAYLKNNQTIWWFGGGYDMTPYYIFEEDILLWHQKAKDICDPYGKNVYFRYKKDCDDYFFLPHRNETRGVGGIIFDDLNIWGFDRCYQFIQSVGYQFINTYIEIVNKRKNIEFDAQEKDFQEYRRGRYVEFNLLYDRGTAFGLQSKGRTESIFISMPPKVKWEYNYPILENSKEAKLNDYLVKKNWLVINQ